MQPKPQKISEVYNKLKQKSNNLLHISQVESAFQQLELNLSDIDGQVKEKYLNKTNDQGQQIVYINQQEFKEIVSIASNRIQALFAEFNAETCKTLRHFKEYMAERDMTVMDRGAEAKTVLRIGQEQQYQNYLKASVQKINGEGSQTIPHIRIEFQTKNEQDKPKLAKYLENIMEKLVQLLKQIVLDNEGGGEQQYTQLMNFLRRSTRTTQKGAQILIQLISEQMNQAMQALATCLDKAFNNYGNSVQGKLKVAFQFNQNLKYLLDKSQPYTIFDFISRNWQLSVTLSLGELMSAIKDIIIKSQQFSELKYQKFHLPGIFAIILTNTEQLETIIELKNIQFTEPQLQMVESFTKAINTLITSYKQDGTLQFVSSYLEQEFKISELIQMLGKGINVYVQLKYFRGVFEVCVEGLGGLLKKLVHFINQGKEDE